MRVMLRGGLTLELWSGLEQYWYVQFCWDLIGLLYYFIFNLLGGNEMIYETGG